MLVFQTPIISVNEFDIILFKTTFFLNAYWSINMYVLIQIQIIMTCGVLLHVFLRILQKKEIGILE